MSCEWIQWYNGLYQEQVHPTLGGEAQNTSKKVFVSGGWLFRREPPQVRHEGSPEDKAREGSTTPGGRSTKISVVVRENEGYIDQGLFISKNVSVFEATKILHEIAETVRSDKDRTGSDKVQILSDQDQTSIKRQSILLEEYRDRSTVKRNSSGTIW